MCFNLCLNKYRGQLNDYRLNNNWFLQNFNQISSKWIWISKQYRFHLYFLCTNVNTEIDMLVLQKWLHYSQMSDFYNFYCKRDFGYFFENHYWHNSIWNCICYFDIKIYHSEPNIVWIEFKKNITPKKRLLLRQWLSFSL